LQWMAFMNRESLCLKNLFVCLFLILLQSLSEFLMLLSIGWYIW